MRKQHSKFPETDARSINVDNSQVTGPLLFWPDDPDGDEDGHAALDPVFKSAFVTDKPTGE